MLGAAAAALQGQAGAASTYMSRVIGYSPDWYLPLGEQPQEAPGESPATALIGPSGTYKNNPQLGVDSIAQDDPGGRSAGFSGAMVETPHVTVSSPLIGPDLTIDLVVQLDDLTKAKHVLITTTGGSSNGQFSLEVLKNGQVRAWSVAGGAARVFLGDAGDVPQGEAVKITYQRQSSATEWSQRVYVNGIVKAQDTTPRTWTTVPAETVYVGTWRTGSVFLDPTDGLIAHVAGWNRLLAPVHMQDLVRTQSVSWAVDIDAGIVQADQSKVISVRQGGWHGKTPLSVTAGDGALVTTTESGDQITILAGSSAGSADNFTFSFTDANGRTSPTRTVAIDVAEASSGVSLGIPLTVFQAARVQVTGLAGWPAGRKPKEVVTQGTHAHGYVRRSWKPTNNDGTWMDFQAGWRKTTAAEVIRIKLDNNSELDLAYTVNHTIPSPGPGSTTRTLDKLGGADFTSWTAAIAACQNNDVLVVRARAGGEVYPVDLNDSGAISTASGVKVVAHPDDLAAGRRPRIHVQATKFARYADELNSGHWVLHQNLGSPHGKVWKSAATISNPVNVGCSYRAKGGGLRRCYTYTNTSGTPGALARLTDTTYPRIAVTPDLDRSTWALYMGPGIYWHSTDQKLYIRLSPLRDDVGAIQVNAAAGIGSNPPWDWSDDDPENEDPNQCQLFISSSNHQNSPGTVTTNTSYILRINGETNWTLENLDFVGGGDTIQMRDGSGHTLRGCRFLGWAPPNMQDDPGQSTVGQVHNMMECENTADVLVDRCEFWGGACPWVGWDENKGRHGAYSIPQKSNLYWLQGSPAGKLALRFVNCLLDGFLTVSRPGGRPDYIKFHQSRLRYWGMDGSLAHESPSSSLEYIRCQMFEFTFAGWTGSPDHTGNQYVGYSLLTNFRPFLHENGWWNSNVSQGNQFCCGGTIIGHESYKDCLRLYFYNNTSIGAHHHRAAAATKLTPGSGGITHDGSSTSIFPYNRCWDLQEWISRNNILAVRPNGSFGSLAGTTGAPSTADSHAGLVFHPNSAGVNRANPVFSQDYNIYHRGSGMPTDSFSGVITTVDSGGVERARSSITDARNDTGQEQNGRIVDPQFVGTWDAIQRDSVLHRNAQWCVSAGSPAASGGDTSDRAWPDMDFGTAVDYGGNTWLGCMDPNASAVEQQVGPLGPLPSGL